MSVQNGSNEQETSDVELVFVFFCPPKDSAKEAATSASDVRACFALECLAIEKKKKNLIFKLISEI